MSRSDNQLYSPPLAPVPSPGSPAPVLEGSAGAPGSEEPVFCPSGVWPCCAPYSWLSASVVTLAGASSGWFVLIVSPCPSLCDQVERVLKNLLERLEEFGSGRAVHDTVVAGERDLHDLPHRHLAVA